MFGCELHPASTGEPVEKLEPLCTVGGNKAASVEIHTGRPHFIVFHSLHFCGVFFWGGITIIFSFYKLKVCGNAALSDGGSIL